MDFHELAGKQFQKASEQVGHDDQDAMLDIVTGLSEDERNELHAFIMQHTYVNFVGNTVSGAFSGGVDPQQLIDLCCQVIPPVILAIGRSLYEDGQINHNEMDKHLAAVAAEVSLTHMLEEEQDLSVIWPSEIAQDVVKTFDDPMKAFYAGVMCGRNNG